MTGRTYTCSNKVVKDKIHFLFRGGMGGGGGYNATVSKHYFYHEFALFILKFTQLTFINQQNFTFKILSCMLLFISLWYLGKFKTMTLIMNHMLYENILN